MKSEIELIISDRISKVGIMSFAEYMELVLFHDEYGYYNNREVFGRNGDFITSPITSNLYGASISNEFIKLRDSMTDPVILEVGAGDGSLVISILEHLSMKKALPETYYIIETSKKLIDLQSENINKKIPELKNIVRWESDDEVVKINGLIICNEFFDILPTERFKIDNGKIFQLFVDYQDKFKLHWKNQTDRFTDIFKNLNIHNILLKYEKYESEVNLNYKLWADKINNILDKGVVFIVDYGYNAREYFLPDRDTGTLVCIHNHSANFNPLENIGMQDISTFVNFSHLASAFRDLKLDVSGYLEQSKFLLNLGILDVFEEKSFNAEDKLIEMNKIKNLILSNAMGDVFKALVITKNYANSLLATREYNRKEIL